MQIDIPSVWHINDSSFLEQIWETKLLSTEVDTDAVTWCGTWHKLHL